MTAREAIAMSLKDDCEVLICFDQADADALNSLCQSFTVLSDRVEFSGITNKDSNAKEILTWLVTMMSLEGTEYRPNCVGSLTIQ